MNHINPPKRDKDKKEYIKISPPSS